MQEDTDGAARATEANGRMVRRVENFIVPTLRIIVGYEY